MRFSLTLTASPETQHELRLRLQQHLSDGLVLIVGSGLSCAEGLSGMGGLADHLIKTIPTRVSGEDLALWKSIVPLLPKGLESALLQNVPSPALEAAIVAETAALLQAEELNVIADVFHGGRTLRLTRLIPHLLKPSSGIPIITTNYDRLVEVALEEAGLGVDTLFVGHFSARLDEHQSQKSFCRGFEPATPRSKIPKPIYQNRAIVLKPHGSLDWYQRNGSPIKHSFHIPTVTPLIITPGRNKFRSGYEQPFDRHRERANQAIDSASRYLIIGYGFNDDHLETHLTACIRSGRPTVFLTYSLSENARELATSLRNVTALESYGPKGELGTRVISEGKEHLLPDINWWDLAKFIEGVLEL